MVIAACLSQGRKRKAIAADGKAPRITERAGNRGIAPSPCYSTGRQSAGGKVIRQKFGAAESNSTEMWEPSDISRGARVTRQAIRSLVWPCSRTKRQSDGRPRFIISKPPALLTLNVVASRVVSLPCSAT